MIDWSQYRGNIRNFQYIVENYSLYEDAAYDREDDILLNEFVETWEMSKFQEMDHPKDNLSVGDVVFTNLKTKTGTRTNPHRFIIVDKDYDEDQLTYKGVMLKSNHSENPKANKFNDKYPDNIYIDDEHSAMSIKRGKGGDGIVAVDEIFEFTPDDINSNSGYWKGKMSSEFMGFLEDRIQDVGTGKNKDKYWIGRDN